MLMKIKKSKKGFTLAELLIVIAIIAVLIAIAIPTFTASLNRARVATEQANARALHAECIAAELAGTTLGSTVYTDAANGVTYTWSHTAGSNPQVVVSGTSATAPGTYEYPETLAGNSTGVKFTPAAGGGGGG